MTATAVRLDLREHTSAPRDPEQYAALWGRIEDRLAGLPLFDGLAHRVELDGEGTVGVLVLRTPEPGAVLGPDTSVVVRGIVEPPTVRYRCTTCEGLGREVYGPFRCTGCGTAERPGRVCDDCVVVLDLAFTRVTCTRHVPSCSCGREATFWCRGRACRARTAWCAVHRHAHPGDPMIGLCPTCLEEEFPRCRHRGCRRTGTLRCESTLGDLSACRTAVCPEHATRWQVYGPRRSGLVLCGDHADALGGLRPDAVVRHVLVGAARRAGAKAPIELPSMVTLRHVLIKTRGEVLRLRQIDPLTHEPAGSVVSGTTATRLRAAIERHRPKWDEEVAGEERGVHLVERLRGILDAEGRSDHARGLEFSSFNVRTGLLFVRLPQHMIGLFKGTRGSNVGRYEQSLSITIRVEQPR